LVRNEFYVEQLLCNDAEQIVIDEEFKNGLKNKIIFGADYKDITKPIKHKNNFKQNRYFKIASGFVICVFVSGTILKAIDIQSKSNVAKGEGTPDVIVSMTGQKESNIPSSKKQGLAQSKETVVSNYSKANLLIVPGISNSTTVSKPFAKGEAGIKDNTSNVDQGASDDEINLGLVNPRKNSSVSIDPKGPIEVPKMGGDNGEVLKSYDSRYSFDEKKLVSVKSGGIYVQDIATSKEKKLIAYNEKTHIVDNPNFTPNDDIIYYKAEKVTLENGNSQERNGAIYLCDKNGEGSTKIVDGKSPMISKDGKKLVYGAEGKIYILTLATKEKRLIDNGNYPAWSDNGNLISYVKEEKEAQSYDESTKKTSYVAKWVSSLWVFDLVNDTTRRLTNKEPSVNNNSIDSWAEAVTQGNIASNIDIEYSYLKSIWSSNNKEIYAIRKNNKAQVFELIKFNLGN
jgi:hypothetical protein